MWTSGFKEMRAKIKIREITFFSACHFVDDFKLTVDKSQDMFCLFLGSMFQVCDNLLFLEICAFEFMLHLVVLSPLIDVTNGSKLSNNTESKTGQFQLLTLYMYIDLQLSLRVT